MIQFYDVYNTIPTGKHDIWCETRVDGASVKIAVCRLCGEDGKTQLPSDASAWTILLDVDASKSYMLQTMIAVAWNSCGLVYDYLGSIK